MSATAEATPLTRREIEARIAKRAWQDEAFRAEFLADPAGCFVKYAGVPAAQLPKITVHEEAPGSWHIVLPAKPAATGELSEEELEKVAGGTDVVLTAVITASVSASASMIVSGVVSLATVTVVTKGDSGW